MYIISILAVLGCLAIALLPLVGRNQSGEAVMSGRTERLKARKEARSSTVVPLAPAAGETDPAAGRHAA